MFKHEDEKKPNGLAGEIQEMKIESSKGPTNGQTQDILEEASAKLRQVGHLQFTPNGPERSAKKSASQSPTKSLSIPQSSAMKAEHEETVGGDITVKLEPGKAPKLSRSGSKKIIFRPPPLFHDLPDATSEATNTFDRIRDCTYANKYLGDTENALECDCAEEWDSANGLNHACGEDSDCINRATKMECVGDCGCGANCQNQRFQHRQYANVTVIKTDKKGYGLRANTNLHPHEFIFEYIGEVIGEGAFRKRIVGYDEEGIKHFYFMSLTKGEFVDATKKGNLGRFCNHSCNPNCYVDKWVVGNKLRMGIFAERKIVAGEELVFNYNVDRYGANPQPCYCGEANCTGYIGGKTQTERATKLSTLTIEALGIEDGDDWDTAVAKKSRKKRPVGEDDEEFVDSVQPKSLDEAGVTKVMATLMQCKEKWIAVKLLSRIQRCDEERVRNRIVKMHGYQILNTALSMWIEDHNVVLQILDILNKLPRLTRNKIQDSKIEATVQRLLTCDEEGVKDQATIILKVWSSLEIGYRIPRMKRDPNAVAAAERAEREERRRSGRDRSRTRSRSRSMSSERPKGSAAPTGPRIGMPQRNPNFFPGSRPSFRRSYPTPLPPGWFTAQSNGQTYYYSASGQTTWQRPTNAAAQPPPPPKVATNEQKLQDIINSITKTSTPKEKTTSNSATPQRSAEDHPHVPKERKEKWRSYDEEKRRKLYENTLFPHVKHVMDKFKNKLPKDDLKRFAKDVAKQLVKSDFKHKRVDDPTKISEKQEKQVKKFVKEYFDKAVTKKAEHDRKKADKKAKEGGSALGGTTSITPDQTPTVEKLDVTDIDEEIQLSENEIEDDDVESEHVGSETDLKRKRESNDIPVTDISPGDNNDCTPSKRIRSDTPPPPPPPPPPPTTDHQMSGDMVMNDASTIWEAGIHPGDDISGSFTAEALEAVNAAPDSYQNGFPTQPNFPISTASPWDENTMAVRHNSYHAELSDPRSTHFIRARTPPPELDKSDRLQVTGEGRVEIRQDS